MSQSFCARYLNNCLVYHEFMNVRDIISVTCMKPCMAFCLKCFHLSSSIWIYSSSNAHSRLIILFSLSFNLFPGPIFFWEFLSRLCFMCLSLHFCTDISSIDAVGSSLSACYVTWFFRWATGSCSLDSLYDLDLISSKIRVILDNSKAWSHILSTSSKLGRKGVVHVNGVSRSDLNKNNQYSNVLLINRTASPLAW